jgi:hypothetical protein
MNKKNLKWIFVIIFLLTFSTPVQADVVATIGSAGLSFVSPELASAVSIALCVMGPTGIITCAAQFVQGKIVGQVIGEAYEVIAEISPEAAQVISTYNQVKGYMDLGAEIVGELSVDETGNIIDGSFIVGKEEISIGNQIGKNLKEGDIKVSNAEIKFSENSISEGGEKYKKSSIILKLNCEPNNIGNPSEYCVNNEENIPLFSRTVYDKDTGEPIELISEILDGKFEFDYESGKIEKAEFRTGSKGTSFLFGVDEVFIPPNSEVEYYGEIIHITPSKSCISELISQCVGQRLYETKKYTDGYILENYLIIHGKEMKIPIIDEIKEPKRMNINGDSKIIKYSYNFGGRNSIGRLESGDLFRGSISYMDGEYFLDQDEYLRIGTKKFFMEEHMDNSKISSIRIENYGHGNEKNEKIKLDFKNLVDYDNNDDIKDFNLDIEKNIDLSFTFGQDIIPGRIPHETKIRSIENSRIKISSRQKEGLIPLLEIESIEKENSFVLNNGLTTFVKDKENLKYIPFSELDSRWDKRGITDPAQLTLIVRDKEGKSILGFKPKQKEKKIIFNELGQFITQPIDDETDFDSIRKQMFSEVLSHSPSVEVLERYFKKQYAGLEINGLQKEHTFEVYKALEMINFKMVTSPKTINFITDLEEFGHIQGYDDVFTIAGNAHHHNREINIIVKDRDGIIHPPNPDVLIHEIGHTLTFKLEEEQNRKMNREVRDLAREFGCKTHRGCYLNLYDEKSEEYDSRWEDIQNKYLGHKIKSEITGELIEGTSLEGRWEYLMKETGYYYGDDLGERTIGSTKNWKGNSGTWADGTHGSRYGCLEEYSCNNYWEDTATFIEEAYKYKYELRCGAWCKKEVRSNPIYLEKLKLLREYGAIPEELYDDISKILEAGLNEDE